MTNRKTLNEPSKTFLRNAFNTAKEAGWKRVIITTPYGTVEATDADSAMMQSDAVNEWDVALGGADEAFEAWKISRGKRK